MRKGGSRTEETVKNVNGRLLRGNEAGKRWAQYFEELLNVQEDIVAVGGVQVSVMGEEIAREEVKRALHETKVRKNTWNGWCESHVERRECDCIGIAGESV